MDDSKRWIQSNLDSARTKSARNYKRAERLNSQTALFVLLTVGALCGRAAAQGPTVDTTVPALPGSGDSLLGPAPGAGGGTFSNLPGTGGIRGVLASGAQRHSHCSFNTGKWPRTNRPSDADFVASTSPVSSTSTPFYGTLEIPASEDDGPPDGVTLDRAIDVALERSLDLRSKFMELPMARADILQASLRSNPLFYQDGQLLQYAGSGTRFSRSAPGGPSQFDTNVSYPLDISHKRQARTVVAARAERVLEMLYQDAVRQRIDDIYDAYVKALEARQTVRYSRQSVEALSKVLALNEQRYQQKNISLGDLNTVKIRLKNSQLGLMDAESDYRKSKLDLGSLMNLTIEEIATLELRGTIQDVSPEPPSTKVLQQVAVDERPDVVSVRLGISRAEADVRLAKANVYSDVYVLWQPYTFQDNSPYGLKSQYSWALGVTVPLPIYNRNQGGIQRAKLNVTQTQIQLKDLERQARIDVEQAVREYQVTRQYVQELHDHVLPEAKQVRNEATRLWQEGVKSQLDFMDALLDYNQTVKQYLDTAVRHRRSMLSLNTVVGRKIMP